MESCSIVYHIHTDPKFVRDVNYFPCERFENRYVVFTDKTTNYNFKVSCLKQSYDNADTLIRDIIRSNARYVVLYDLNTIKAYIANRLPSDTIVIWRFFGYELYSKILSEVLADEEFLLSSQMDRKGIREYWGDFKRMLFPGKSKEIQKSYNRINYFMCLFEEEYDYLSRFFNLPPFLIIPRNIIPRNYADRFDDIEKDNTILIGNNRGIYNNHLEILNVISEIDKLESMSYNFTLLFNYGTLNKYTERVINEAKKNQGVKVINDFMPLEKFKELYTKVPALVINGYRQMAMGNIMTALQNGTKVYLNKKNCTYKWLSNHGFSISLIEELVDDIKNHNIELTYDEKVKNSQLTLKLNHEYSVERFLSMLNAE